MTGKYGRKTTREKVPEKVTERVTENQQMIIESMKQNPTAQERIKKTTQKTTQKIITFLHINPDATRKDIAVEAGITEDGVKYHLAKLQKQGLIRRVGPDKGGRCEILEPDLRWFPADEALRESSYDRLLPPRVHKSLQEIKAWMRKILKSTNPALSGV